MFAKILSCPAQYFDSTPTGRVLNRQGEDQMLMDFSLPLQLEVYLIILSKTMETCGIVRTHHPRTRQGVHGCNQASLADAAFFCAAAMPLCAFFGCVRSH